MAATAERRASNAVVTTTHIWACSPRQDSSRHTPDEGLGARSGPSRCQAAHSRAPGRGAQIADAFHLRCSRSHDTAFCLSQRGVTVQVVHSSRLKPSPSSGPPLGRLTNHYRDHLAGRRAWRWSGSRCTLGRPRRPGARNGPIPQLPRAAHARMRAPDRRHRSLPPRQFFTCTCVTSFVRWTHPNRSAFQAVSCDLARKRFRRPAEQEQRRPPHLDTSSLGGYRQAPSVSSSAARDRISGQPAE